ncbi:speedy protein 1-A-like [Daphnia carinata]|uniref:speedy protein 1-A-like n=1 Tax=Daphnia carinata TaxID=120202 RepID=UPI00286894D2|nr:speedy protein 1-A-like [Daphnia carinata]
MVIGNTVKHEEISTSLPPNISKPCYAVERKVGQEEWRLAVETVLPRLLGPPKLFKRKKTVEYREDNENACSNGYFDAICDFGRWLGNVRNCFHHNWATGTWKKKTMAVSLTPSRMKDFFMLLEDDRIKRFVEYDKCKIFADSYLLAMVFTYFLRAGFRHEEYNYDNFCTALLLAHEIEEENFLIEEVVVEWETATIQNGNEDFVPMHRLRYELFVRMDYRALVSRKVCEDIIALCPEHWAWKRKRHEHHSGVYQSRRYPAQDHNSRSLIQLVSGPNPFYGQCEPCLKLEKINAAILAKKEARTAGNRLTLKKRHPPTKSEAKFSFLSF